MMARSVLITGCTAGGIGHALAKEYFRLGLRVIATARRKSTMKDLEDLGIETFELDVANPDSISRLKAELGSLLEGKLDILVNNAGVCYEDAILDIPLERIRSILDVNVIGVILMVQAFSDMLIASADQSVPQTATQKWLSQIPFLSSFFPRPEGGHGVIVNIGSVNSFYPLPFTATYNASKAAINQLSDTMRLELSPFNVKVLNIITGAIQTKMTKSTSQEVQEQVERLKNSRYAPLGNHYFASKEKLHHESLQKPDDYAREVATQTLSPDPPARLWKGKYTTRIWFLQTFFCHTVFDNRLLGRYHLLKFGLQRRLAAARRAD